MDITVTYGTEEVIYIVCFLVVSIIVLKWLSRQDKKMKD